MSTLRSSLRFYLAAFALCLLVLLAACASTGVPERVPILTQDVALALAPQPPALPAPPPAKPLPNFPGHVPVIPNLRVQTVTDRVQMRVLVISASSDDYGLSAWKALLDQVGVPYEVLLADTQPLAQEQLVAANGDGRFQGVVLTSNNLAYFDGNAWVSAFTAEEWNLLWQYERDYAVRQVSLYSYPSTYPEDYGLSFANVKDTSSVPYPVSLTPDGWKIFNYLQKQVSIPLRYTYTYLAALDPASTSTSVKPLIKDASGNILAAQSVSADGRERLALTFANNPYFIHTQLLGYGLIRWVTKGLFLGERALYLSVDVDDWFLSNDEWDPATNSIRPDAYRLTSQDALSFSQQQSALKSHYSLARNYKTAIAYNGEGANLSAPASCDPSVVSPDPLTSMTRCLRNSFFWLNHSYSHEYFDFLSYTDAKAQIRDNRPVARELGLRQPNEVLITGDVSGLGWYNPDGDGPKTDYGLEASNPEFLRAAKDLKVRVVAANASVPSQLPPCHNCGIYHPLEPSILLVPRWPTNLFYSVTTPEEVVSAYNGVYGPQGTFPYWDHELSYSEFLDVESDIALYHLLSFSPYPHFFHVANLREYTPGRSILTDYLERLLQKYSSYYRLNLKSPSWAALGTYVAQRTSFTNAEALGVWDRAAKTVTLSTPRGGTIFLTGARVGTYKLYGGDPTATYQLSAGASVTVTLPSTF